jgi:hypothetical protein
MSSNPQPPPPETTEVKKVSGVIVTHGHLAGELLAAAEMIIGPGLAYRGRFHRLA